MKKIILLLACAAFASISFAQETPPSNQPLQIISGTWTSNLNLSETGQQPTTISGEWNSEINLNTVDAVALFTVYVRDAATGKPIAGAGVWFPTLPQIGGATDKDGCAKFTANNLPDGIPFQVAFLGYYTQEIMTDGASNYDVVLKPVE